MKISCPICGCKKFKKESKAFCCHNGKKVAKKLEFLNKGTNGYESELIGIYKENKFTKKCRKVNYLFCFSTQSIDPSKSHGGKGFINVGAPANVKINGRTYHVIHPTNREFDSKNFKLSRANQGVYWFFHDPDFLSHDIISDKDVKMV